LIKRNEPEIIQPLFTRPSFIPETSLSTTTREEEDDEEEGNL
jgi:hypothetical protein